jgi:hypothetical protein
MKAAASTSQAAIGHTGSARYSPIATVNPAPQAKIAAA